MAIVKVVKEKRKFNFVILVALIVVIIIYILSYLKVF
jgi:hypothetical protein